MSADICRDAVETRRCCMKDVVWGCWRGPTVERVVEGKAHSELHLFNVSHNDL